MERPARPRAPVRRGLHGRHVRGRGGLDRGFPRPRCARAGRRPALGRPARGDAIRSGGGSASSIGAPTRGAMSPTTTISTTGSTRCSSIPTASTAAPISRRPASPSTTPSSPRNGIWRPSFSSGPGDRILDIGSGWGGPCTLSRRVLPGAGDRDHPVERAARGGAGAGRRRRARIQSRFQAHRLPGCRGPLRPHRLGRHVRACRRRLLRRLLPQMRGAARRRRRDGAAFDRALGSRPAPPTRGFASTSSPAATFRRCPRCCRPSSARGSSSPTSRFSAFIMRRPSPPGASASSPIAKT